MNLRRKRFTVQACPRFFLQGSRFTLLLFTLYASLFTCSSQVKPGADLLFTTSFDLIKGKNVGLVTNHTGVLSSGEHLADALHRNSQVHLVALFAPEHGVRGDSPAGAKVGTQVDERTGVQVFSLYGATYKPTQEMLSGIDVLLFDIQDVGARFYTYISTLSYAMEAAAEKGIPVVVLDRPNPVRGTWVEGFVRDDSLRSFVGLHRIPIVHGMTVGELATMFNEERWLKDGIKAALRVVKMSGWKRDMWYDQTGLEWIPPSPNMMKLATAEVYPGTGLIEGTNLSEGRGTPKPFLCIGAPYVDGIRLSTELNSEHLGGVKFVPVRFTPKDMVGAAMNPKYKGVECGGILIYVAERDIYEPVRAGISILAAVRRLFPEDFKWRTASIDRLAGTRRLRQELDAGRDAKAIASEWSDELVKFGSIRSRYLMY